MKIVVLRPERRVGATVIDLNRASAQLPARLLNFIEAGGPALEQAKRVIDRFGHAAPARDGIVEALSTLKLHAPEPDRGERLTLWGS